MAFRILIADDHQFIRQYLRLLIQSHPGWEVCSEAENGDDAVAKAGTTHPDVVLLDLAMPGMDGLAAAGHIRKVAPAPIILYTLHARPELERAAQVLGVYKVIPQLRATDLETELQSLSNAATSKNHSKRTREPIEGPAEP